MSGSSAIVLSNRSYPTPTVASNFAKNPYDWQTLLTTTTMPTGGSISRAGNAMLYDSTGKLTYAPNNILHYSNTFSNAYWIKDGVTISNANAVSDPFGGTQASTLTSASGNKRLLTNAGAFASTQMINAIWIRRRTGTGTITFWTPAEVATDITSQVTSSWTQVSLKGDATVTNYFNLILATVGDEVDIYGATASLVTYETTPRSGDQVITTSAAAYYGPRFDYDPSTLAANGLLIEGARTNYAIYSEQFNDASWLKYNATVTANAVTSPDGTTTADLLYPTGSSAFYGSVYRTTSTGTILSVYAKAAGFNYLCLWSIDGGAGVAWFNLNTGAIGTVNAAYSATIQSVGNGWYRCSVRKNDDSVFTSTQIQACSADNSTTPTASGTNGIYIWGAQFEAASFPSSYIPTVASSVARSPDTFSITGYSSNLIEAYYTDEATGIASSLNYAAGTAPSTSYGWTTSLRVYTNAYAGDIASPSWIDNSGTTGNRMVTDSTGMLTWAPANMLLNSATLSTQSITTLAQNYILSFKGTGSVTCSGTNTTVLAGTGASNRVSAVLTCSAGTLTLTVSGTVTEAQVEPVTYQTSPRAYIPTTSAAVYQPRYDFDPSTVPATPRGLLIEETRQNVCLQSQNFSATAWQDAGVFSATLASGIAPDGTNTANLLTAAATTNQFRPFNTLSSSTAYTFTLYLKSGTSVKCRINLHDFTNGNDANSYISWASGVPSIDAGATGSPSITSVGSGWYKFTATITTGAGAGANACPAIYPDTVNGTGSIYVWGAQLEAGSFATSYIPTTSAAVTRAADIVKLTGSALTTLQGSAASLVFQFNTSRTAPGFIDDNTGSSSIAYANASDWKTYTGTTGLTPTGTYTLGANSRGGIAFSAAGRSSSLNGGTVSSNSVTMQSISTVTLGRAFNSIYLNGYAQSLAIYNQHLPDAILKQKSTVGAAY
ncbi:putative tail fiber protein [Caudoviricetes sp.]|nr:putative tail fiber protein [Caudoviricetes sp.]UOF81478.1 putative tail fiber protein [Caudoviricetes sp.]